MQVQPMKMGIHKNTLGYTRMPIKMGIHKNTLGYTRMPIKIGIQSAPLAEIHQLQDENVVLNRIVPYRIASLRVYHVYIM